MKSQSLLSLAMTGTPLVYLLLATTCSVWRQDVLAEEYSLSPDVASFVDGLRGMKNCGAVRDTRGFCGGRNATFRQSPAMMDDLVTFMNDFCYCDPECHVFSDCCADVADLTGKSANRSVKGIPTELWSCEPLNINRTKQKVSIHMVSACPFASTPPRHKCVVASKKSAVDGNHLMDMPVMDDNTGVWYQNVFCAVCNGVFESLAPMNRSLMCPDDVNRSAAMEIIAAGNATYFPGELRWEVGHDSCYFHLTPARWSDRRADEQQHIPGFYRPCVATVDTCPPHEDPSPTSLAAVAAARCPTFAYYLRKDGSSVYKNHYCAVCNGQVPKNLLCWTPLDPFRVIQRVNFNPPKLSMLMAYDWDLNWGQGRVVSAPSEVIYDSISSRCIPLTASIFSYIVEDNRCVRTEETFTSGQTSTNATGCERLELKRGDFKILDNTSLVVFYNVRLNDYEIDGDNYELLDDGNVAVCAKKSSVSDKLIFSDRAESILTAICLTISTICLCLHIIAYSSIPKLKNLPGLNLLSLSWSLLLGQFIFLFGVHPLFGVPRVLCVIIAVLIHYFYLAAFFWMNVMSYDIWRKFTTPTPESGHTGLHRKYSIYAWVTPAVIVLGAVVMDFVTVLPPYARPNYGYRDTCWFGSPLGLGIFFAAPVVLILIANVILFSTTVRKIIVQKRESANYIRKQAVVELLAANERQRSSTGRPSASTRSPTLGAKDHVRLYLYVKLFTIMGLTWIVGFVAAFTGLKALWFPFVILNGLQGAFIFAMFACKRSIGAAMWDKTVGRKFDKPDFLKTPAKSDASNGTASSMSTTRSRLSPTTPRTSSGVDDAVHEGHGQRQKLRVRMSTITYEEENGVKTAAGEENITKADISSTG